MQPERWTRRAYLISIVCCTILTVVDVVRQIFEDVRFGPAPTGPWSRAAVWNPQFDAGLMHFAAAQRRHYGHVMTVVGAERSNRDNGLAGHR